MKKRIKDTLTLVLVCVLFLQGVWTFNKVLGQENVIYVTEGSGGGSGTENDPYQGLDYALNRVSNGSIIHLLSNVRKDTTPLTKEVTIRGNNHEMSIRGDLILGSNVEMQNLQLPMTRDGSNISKIYMNGHKLVLNNVSTRIPTLGGGQDAERPIIYTGFSPASAGNVTRGNKGELLISGDNVESKFQAIKVADSTDLAVETVIKIENKNTDVLDTNAQLELSNAGTNTVKVENASIKVRKFKADGNVNVLVVFKQEEGTTRSHTQVVLDKISVVVVDNTKVSVTPDFFVSPDNGMSYLSLNGENSEFEFANLINEDADLSPINILHVDGNGLLKIAEDVRVTTPEPTTWRKDDANSTQPTPPPSNGVNKNNLAEAIEEAKKIKTTAQYYNATADAKESFDEALMSAEEIFADQQANQATVQSGTSVLLDAMDELEGQETDKSSLETLIAATEASKTTAKYYNDTAEKQEALNTALTEAKEVQAKENATQSEVEAVKTKLQEKKDALSGADTDKQELINSLNQAEETKNSVKYTNETSEEEKRDFDSKLETAKMLKDKLDATQIEVNDAKNKLDEAKAKLDGVAVDKQDLTEKIDEAEAVKLTPKYYNATADKKTALDNALTEAKRIKELESARQNEVDDAKNTLIQNKEALDGVETNKEALNSLITESEASKTTAKYYNDTAEKQEALNTALTEAKEVQAKENATQSEVESAKTKLQEKKDALSGADTNKQLLANEIAKANETKSSAKYINEESAEEKSAFDNKLTLAETVNSNPSARQTEVDEALNQLTEAMSKLDGSEASDNNAGGSGATDNGTADAGASDNNAGDSGATDNGTADAGASDNNAGGSDANNNAEDNEVDEGNAEVKPKVEEKKQERVLDTSFDIDSYIYDLTKEKSGTKSELKDKLPNTNANDSRNLIAILFLALGVSALSLKTKLKKD